MRSLRPAPGDQIPSVITSDAGAHSEKPAAVVDMITHLYPTVTKLEMYARNAEPREGCDFFGNEAVHGDKQK